MGLSGLRAVPIRDDAGRGGLLRVQPVHAETTFALAAVKQRLSGGFRSIEAGHGWALRQHLRLNFVGDKKIDKTQEPVCRHARRGGVKDRRGTALAGDGCGWQGWVPVSPRFAGEASDGLQAPGFPQACRMSFPSWR